MTAISSSISSTRTVPGDDFPLEDVEWCKDNEDWPDDAESADDVACELADLTLKTPGDLRKAQIPDNQPSEPLPPFGMPWEDFMRGAKGHFRSDPDTLQVDTLQAQVDKVLGVVSNTRFVSPRALTQLDALIASVFAHKPSLAPTLGSILARSVTRSFLENRLSYATFAFLLGASSSIKADAPPSFVAMLKRQYCEEMDF